MNKFKAIKTEVDGITFDSKREAKRYCELKLLQKHLAITDLECQPKFDLIVNGKKVATYISDFRYYDIQKSEWVIEDVKSKITKTPVYRLKKKILEAQEPSVIITEIM